jgi:4-hydroxy-tetrahydrodipicolinate reductase
MIKVKKMNIAIVGYGKMGREIEKAAKEKGLTIKSIIDPQVEGVTHKEINKESLKDVDVVVDFTHPDSAVENIKKVSDLGKNMVVGTTGWYDKIDEVKKIVEKSGTGLIWSGNFSLGVNIFFRIIEDASKIIDKFDDYDVFVHELHHNQKADSPSGTAVMIGKILTENIARKKKIVTEELKRRIKPDEIHVSSTRSGSIPGTHIIGFDSKADTIELKHTARGRQGFALGAVMAAEWIKDKKGFFDINSMMNTITGGE